MCYFVQPNDRNPTDPIKVKGICQAPWLTIMERIQHHWMGTGNRKPKIMAMPDPLHDGHQWSLTLIGVFWVPGIAVLFFPSFWTESAPGGF